MRLYNIYGKLQNRNVSKFLIDWDKKSRSKVQFAVKSFLFPFWKAHVVYEEFPVFGSRMKVDIMNFTKKIAIEVQGAQHNNFNAFFHKNSRANYLESIKRDVKKAEWLERNAFHLIEINENEAYNCTKEWFEKKFKVSL